jgi:hypothetical protein
MESAHPPRKRDRLIPFRRKGQVFLPPPTSVSAELQQQPTPAPSHTESPDRQRSKARYLEAITLLEDAVKGREALWGSFDFAQLQGELDDLSPSQFRECIDTVIERNASLKKITAWGKCEDALQCCFTAFAPFAKNLLIIAKEGQAVSSVHAFLTCVASSIESIWITLWRLAGDTYC